MGLDMYLTRKKYIDGNYDWNKIEGKIEIKKDGKEIPLDIKKIKYIVEDVGYWRKANAIHRWFVNHVQDGNDDCGCYGVEISDLEELLKICKKIKEKVILKDGLIKNGQQFENDKWEDIYIGGKFIENPEICEQLLPTGSGFFFGSTEYDEYYMKDINYTIEVLEQVIKEQKELNSNGIYSYLEYCSSW